MSIDENIYQINNGHDQKDQDSCFGECPLTPGVYYPRNELQRRQKPFRRKPERFVFKNGEFNIEKYTLTRSDLFSRWLITIVEARWRWTLITFLAAFTVDWLFFGFIYWIIAITHGDLTEEHLPPNQNATAWTPCVKNIYGFTSTFLFSIEVHTTLAYGRRSITLDCSETIVTICLQYIISSFIQAFMIKILFAKLTRPKVRTQTILFSKQVVINLRDDKFCMIFRVGDIRKSRILNIKFSVYVLRFDIDYDNADRFEQIELKVEMNGSESIFTIWPVSVIHVIDETSPLYGISAADLLCSKIEILAVFEGIIESTGQLVQARSSYIENDITWGHRFVPMLTDDQDKSEFDIDFSKLSETEHFDTPLCSAKEYDSVVVLLKSELDNNN